MALLVPTDLRLAVTGGERNTQNGGNEPLISGVLVGRDSSRDGGGRHQEQKPKGVGGGIYPARGLSPALRGINNSARGFLESHAAHLAERATSARAGPGGPPHFGLGAPPQAGGRATHFSILCTKVLWDSRSQRMS
jgi:hypothetical protein